MRIITTNRVKAQKEGTMAEKYSLEDYETVELRLRRLYGKYPLARIITDMVYRDERSFIIKAELFLDRDDTFPVATGYAEEIVGAGFVNKTSALENCETSAIGRCISNSVLMLDAPIGKRPSQQEMEKVERYAAEPRRPLTPKTVKPKREYTEAEINEAKNLIESAQALVEVGDLRELWTGNPDHLDIPVSGTTLKDIINKRVRELQTA
jgi:hypothetical protein